MKKKINLTYIFVINVIKLKLAYTQITFSKTSFINIDLLNPYLGYRYILNILLMCDSVQQPVDGNSLAI